MEEDKIGENVGVPFGKDYLLVWKIYYLPGQQEVVDEFNDFCKKRGYKHISGIQTLLDKEKVNEQLTLMAMRIAELNGIVAELQQNKPQEATKLVQERPKTLGTSK